LLRKLLEVDKVKRFTAAEALVRNFPNHHTPPP
jgi:hypothetical protein